MIIIARFGNLGCSTELLTLKSESRFSPHFLGWFRCIYRSSRNNGMFCTWTELREKFQSDAETLHVTNYSNRTE